MNANNSWPYHALKKAVCNVIEPAHVSEFRSVALTIHKGGFRPKKFKTTDLGCLANDQIL